MPRLISNRLAAACALAIALSIPCAASAAAKGFSAELRVVGSGGRTLAEKPVAARTTSIRTSPRALCFGAGSGGSGDSVAIPGNTAMGLLATASKSTGALRPLKISDHFDFGLAMCGIGSSVARGSASWYLKVNHRSPAVGGEKARIQPGDEVLWALVKTTAPDYEYPDDLALSAPATATPGLPFPVQVFAYDGKGGRTPLAGASVNGAVAPTGTDGRTLVALAGPARLTARFGSDIPSGRQPVCVGGKCPR